MKKITWIGFFMLIIVVLAGCNDDTLEITNTPDTNIFVLTEESASDLRNGIITGTPLRRDLRLELEDVKKVWGEPVQVYDHEDIQTYEYIIKDRKILIDEEETGLLYIFTLEMGITREEILHYMGEPTEGKETGKTLVYHDTDYRIAFRKRNEPKAGDKETWDLIYYHFPKEY